MTNPEIINSLFDSYKFTEAMPDDVREAIIQSKKEVLIKILKKTGKYSLFTLLLINIVLLLKKFGIGATAAKVYFISAVATIAVTGSAAGLAVIGYHSLKTQPASETKAPVSTPVDMPAIKKTNKKTVLPAIQYAIEITPFKSRNDIVEESSLIAAHIRRILTSISGEGAAVLSKNDSTFNTKFVVNGVLAKIGEKYYIGVKLVDTSNSEIITQINRTAEGKENLDSAASEIARELAVFVK